MAANSLSESDTTETSSSDTKPETLETDKNDYEKQRQLRIADNKARMEAMGLPKMAVSLMGSPQKSKETKRKLRSKRVSVKQEEDDDYSPDDAEGSTEGFSSSGEEFEVKNVNSKKSGKVKGRKSRSNKEVSVQKSMDSTDYKDEDEALMQAIALSLKDSGEISGTQRCGSSQVSNEKEGNTRRKRKSFTSRVQMTADDLIIHFCQFDEVGNGSINVRDLKRMAAINDFTWTDNEFADMILCFDRDKDGKLTLDDFRNIVTRCNMLQMTENA